MDSVEYRLNIWRDHFEWRYVEAHYPKCRILDFGCGEGWSDIWLARSGFTVVGYDVNPDSVAIANTVRDLESPEVQQRLSFGEVLNINQAHDLVWSSHVFEHIPLHNWRGILESFAEMGAPVLISVPLGYAYDMHQHIHHWDDADALLRELHKHSEAAWSAFVDNENLVIRAMKQ